MNSDTHVAAYRRLTSLYPKSFRGEYGDDLVDVFASQLDDDGGIRSWLRAAQDLIITVPSQHLEAHMNRPPVNFVATLAFAIAVAATIGAILTGGSVYTLIFVLVAFVAVCIAVLAWRASRPVVLSETARLWKRFLASGIALLATIIVIVNLPPMEDGDYADGVWYLMFFSFVLSIMLIAGGILLGVAQRSTPKRSSKVPQPAD